MLKAVQSRRVVTPLGMRPARVVHEDGVILRVEEHSPDLRGLDVLDAGELYVLPGLVDTHVHINEPGRADWEGFRTGTQAAAAGGYTCIVDMPLNSIPATTNADALEQKRKSAQAQCRVDYAFWGGAVPGNADELIALAEAGVRGFKCFLSPSGVAEFERVREPDVRAAAPVIQPTGLPLLVHAEWPDALHDSGGKTWHTYDDYLASRPAAAELAAIEVLIRVCRETHCPIHIVHLAAAEALPMLAAARSEGLPVSVETCPHYLFFSAEEIPDGATQYKCAPPIRKQPNQQALWAGLQSGVIDLIATDHSPCPPSLKDLETGDFAQAWGGIASLSVALPAIYTAATEKGIGMERIVEWMSAKPACLAGLEHRKGRLASGFDADFLIFDPDESFVVTADRLYFKHKITPYMGKTLRGGVKHTFLRGECVFAEGEFPNAMSGRECRA